MSKERLSAFFDAVLAIIMTILVLELEKPAQLNWEGLVELAPNFFAYTLSFFWLGAMWMGIHNTWHKIERISNTTLNSMIVLLFFSSLFPYTTSIVATHFDNRFAQSLYGVVSLLVTFTVLFSYQTLVKANPNNTRLSAEVAAYNRIMAMDIGIKVIGLCLTLTVYPPAMIYSIVLASLSLVLSRGRKPI